MFRSHITRTVFGVSIAITMSTGLLAADFTKEQLSAARDAINASHVADGVENLLIVVAEQTKANLVRTSPSYSNQIEAATTKVALQLAGERVDLDRAVQQLWAAKFTIPELQEITRFYSSPTGQKLAKETAGLINGAGQALQAYQQKLSQDMYTKTREELKKQGLPF